MNHRKIYKRIKTSLFGHFRDERIKFNQFLQVELALTLLYRVNQRKLGGIWIIFSNYRNLPISEEDKSFFAKLSYRYSGITSMYFWKNLIDLYLTITNERNLFVIETCDELPWEQWNIQLNTFLLEEEINNRIEMYINYLRNFEQTSKKTQFSEPNRHYQRRSRRTRHSWIGIFNPEFLLQPEENLQPVPRISPDKIIIPLEELREIAIWIQKKDSERDWVSQFELIESHLINPDTGVRVKEILLTQIHHLVGLVSSGKSTLIYIIMVWCHQNNIRVTLILNDVASQLEKAQFFERLGLTAVPFFGKSILHQRNVEAYSRLTEKIRHDALFDSFEGIDKPPTEFNWLGDTCLLNGTQQEEFRIHSTELPPCQSLYESISSEKRYTCRYIQFCPRYNDYQNMFKSNVWIVNPDALIKTIIPRPFLNSPTPVLELVYRYSQIIIGDEADLIQARFDSIFSENYTVTGIESLDDYNRSAEENLSIRDYRPYATLDTFYCHQLINYYNVAKSNLYNQVITRHNHVHKVIVNMTRNSVFNVDSLLRKLCNKYELSKECYEDLRKTTKRNYLERNIIQERMEFNCNTLFRELERIIPQSVLRTINGLSGSEDFNRNTNTYQEIQKDKKSVFLIFLNFIYALAVFDYYLQKIVDKSEVFNILFKLNLEEYQSVFQNRFKRYRSLIPVPIHIASRSGYKLNEHDDGGASIEVIRYHGVGRFILLHFYDLFQDQLNIVGPKVLLASSTSWVPESDKYHVDITPDYLLKSSRETSLQLGKSKVIFVKTQKENTVAKVSGKFGLERFENLKFIVQNMLRGGEESHLQQKLESLPDNRKNILLTVGSYKEALIVLEVFKNHLHWRNKVMCLVPDGYSLKDDNYHLFRGQIELMRYFHKQILIAPTISIERGLNILNEREAAYFGAIGFLVRPYPVPYDFNTLIGFINRLSMKYYDEGLQVNQDFDTFREFLNRNGYRAYNEFYQNQKPFKHLDGEFLEKIISTMTILMLQTIGRTIRGEVPTQVYLYDGAFIDDPHHDNPLEDPRSYIRYIIDFMLNKKDSDPVSIEIFSSVADLFKQIEMEVL